METSTKLPGDRLRFPVLTLSSVSGVSSIPDKEKARHKKGGQGLGSVLLAKTGQGYSRRRIRLALAGGGGVPNRPRLSQSQGETPRACEWV